MTVPIQVEVCTETVAGALAAEAAGADRLELCSALVLGGLTPGPGLLAEVMRRVEAPVVVLCRPRRGDFSYDGGEFAALVGDVEAARSAGASPGKKLLSGSIRAWIACRFLTLLATTLWRERYINITHASAASGF